MLIGSKFYVFLSLIVCIQAQLCKNNPCRNNGHCIDQGPSNIYGYTCKPGVCLSEWTGYNCDLPTNNKGILLTGGASDIDNGNQQPGDTNSPPKKPGIKPMNMPMGPNGNIIFNSAAMNPNNQIGGGGGSIYIGGAGNNPFAAGNIFVNDQGPCTGNPCLNQGLCRPDPRPLFGNSYICSCRYPYTGRNCEIYRRFQNGGILVGSIMPFLFCFGLLSLCIYCCCCKNRNQPGFQNQGMMQRARVNITSLMPMRKTNIAGTGVTVYTNAPNQDPDVAFRAYPNQRFQENPPPYSAVVKIQN